MLQTLFSLSRKTNSIVHFPRFKVFIFVLHTFFFFLIKEFLFGLSDAMVKVIAKVFLVYILSAKILLFLSRKLITGYFLLQFIVIDESLPAIFYFTAVWCGPCKFLIIQFGWWSNFNGSLFSITASSFYILRSYFFELWYILIVQAGC